MLSHHLAESVDRSAAQHRPRRSIPLSRAAARRCRPGRCRGKSGSTYPFTYAFGSNTGPDLSVGSTHVTPNTGVGDLTHALGMNLLLNSGTVTWTSPTTLNLGATGTLTLYEKVEGPIKHVVGLLQGYTGTFTYTYPSAYLTTAPFEDDALALGTATTGSVTIRAATSTNGVIKFSGK